MDTGPTGFTGSSIDYINSIAVSDTGPTGPSGDTGATLSPYILTLTDLLSSHDALIQKEAADKASLSILTNPDASTIKSSLFQWARLGFPNVFPILSITLTVPPVCSDGTTRTFYDYITYVLGHQVGDDMLLLQAKLPGMKLSYSLDWTSITFHVEKA